MNITKLQLDCSWRLVVMMAVLVVMPLVTYYNYSRNEFKDSYKALLKQDYSLSFRVIKILWNGVCGKLG